jgi:hypothetical protein
MSKSSKKREIQRKMLKIQEAEKQGAITQFKQAPQANKEKLNKR